MKRILILAFLILPLACVPTPDEEFVVNKSDNVLEQKLESENTQSDLPQSSALIPQIFPDRWQKEPYQTNFKAKQITGVYLDENGKKVTDTQDVTGVLQLTVDAEIVQKADGIYPVYRTKSSEMTKECASQLLKSLYPAPTEVYVYEQTKDELKQAFQAYLDLVQEKREWAAAGKPDRDDWDEYVPTEEEVAEQSKQYMERIETAPDKLETRAVSDYSDLAFGDWIGWNVYTLTDGHSLHVSASETGILSVLDNGYVYHSYDYEWDKAHKEGDYRHWKDVSMTREDADQKLLAALSDAGLTGYAITWAYPANVIVEVNGKTKSIATGWSYSMHRDYGGYPVPDLHWRIDQSLNYETDHTETFAAPIQDEQFEITVGPDGILSFYWIYPREMVELVNENVELIPFDTVKQRVENAVLTMINPLHMRRHSLDWYEEHGCIPITIYRMVLSTYTIRERNAETYYEMPCWLVFYGEDDSNRQNMDESYSCLILNAVDGSIVHPDLGY